MKKKLFGIIAAAFVFVPCAVGATACAPTEEGNGEGNGEPVSVSISFALDEENAYLDDRWQIDEATNTYTTDYVSSLVWQDYMFKVIATTENGHTRQLFEVNNPNDAGYKIDTNMPDINETENGRLPAGEYYYRLYCDDFNDGNYKTNACSSETYKIIVNKTVVDMTEAEFAWRYNDTLHVYAGHPIAVGLYPNFEKENAPLYNDLNNMQEYGITDFEYINDETYTNEETDAGNYVAKVQYKLDTQNFTYIGLPEGMLENTSLTFEWSIEKGTYDPFYIPTRTEWVCRDESGSGFIADMNGVLTAPLSEAQGRYYICEVEISIVYDSLTLEYSVDGGAWTTEKPKFSEVGTHIVKARITGMDEKNYHPVDISDGCWEITVVVKE